jgi:hypothetical protein
MVKSSKRKRLIYELETILEFMLIDGKDSSKDFNDLLLLLESVNSSRLFDSIRGHPDFTSDAKVQQTKIWVQLMVVLNRLGCDGNGASIGALARMGGISHGSVVNFTDRVFTALLEQKDEVVKWPSPAERKEISDRFAENHGLEGAVGIVDGTPVNFAVRPHVDGEVWFNRKQRYAMNVQLICDDRGRIIYYIVGWPGSVFDATILGQSSIAMNPQQYFSNNEFLLADAGYARTWWCCTPYRNTFDELFSFARVKIEYVNGIWKARFSSFKGLRI